MCYQCPTTKDEPSELVQGRLVGGSLAKEAISKEKSAIDTELSIGADVVERLHSIISVLQNRVAPVSTPNDNAEARESRGPLGSSTVYFRVFDNNNNVAVAVDRLQALMRDLEV